MLATRTGIERVQAMPRERILLETDGPFGKINAQSLRPSAVYEALAQLAILWGVDLVEAKANVEGNQRAIWAAADAEHCPS